VALQPLAVIDHSCKVDDAFLKSIPGEVGGSTRIDPDELQRILMQVAGAYTRSLRSST